jgi:hypothetical protein
MEFHCVAQHPWMSSAVAVSLTLDSGLESTCRHNESSVIDMRATQVNPLLAQMWSDCGSATSYVICNMQMRQQKIIPIPP